METNISAVEWLAKQVNTLKWRFADVTDRNAIIEQAKAMEQQQIIEAHRSASMEAGFEHSAQDWALEYYNSTYTKETYYDTDN